MDGSVPKENPVSAIRSRLSRDVAQTMGTKLAVVGLGLGTGIVTARLLGPHDRGLFALLVTLPTTLAILVKFGLAQANIYYMQRHKAEPYAVVVNSLVMALALGGACMILALCLRGRLLGTILRGASDAHFLLLLPLMPAELLQSYLFGFLQGQGRFTFFNRRLLAQAVATLTGMIVVLWMLQLGMLAALLVAVGVQVGSAIWVLVTSLSIAPRGQCPLSGRLLGAMLRFGIKSHLQVVIAHLHHRIDLYMIAFFLNPAEVAFYAIATRIAELLFIVPESLGLAIYPRLAAEDERGAQAMTARACRSMFAPMVCGGILLACLSPGLIRLWYGTAYAPAGAPLPLLLLGVGLMSLYNLISRNFTSRNRQQVNIVAASASLIVNLSLNTVLIPRIGIVGAAAATAVSYGLAAAIVCVKFLGESHLRPSDLLMPSKRELSRYFSTAPLVRSFFP